MKGKSSQDHPKSILHTQPMNMLSEHVLCSKQYAALVAYKLFHWVSEGTQYVQFEKKIASPLRYICLLFNPSVRPSVHLYIRLSLCPGKHKSVNEFDFRHRQTAEFEVT